MNNQFNNGCNTKLCEELKNFADSISKENGFEVKLVPRYYEKGNKFNKIPSHIHDILLFCNNNSLVPNGIFVVDSDMRQYYTIDEVKKVVMKEVEEQKIKIKEDEKKEREKLGGFTKRELSEIKGSILDGMAKDKVGQEFTLCPDMDVFNREFEIRFVAAIANKVKERIIEFLKQLN